MCDICSKSSYSSCHYQLIVKDITPSSGSSRRGKKEKSDKVLLSEFENPKLALFAKCCTRLATCSVNMCPEDALFSWPTFTEEFERLMMEGRCPDFVGSLDKINAGDGEQRDKLVRFVSAIPEIDALFIGHQPGKDELWLFCCTF